jgi:hypothetical protein
MNSQASPRAAADPDPATLLVMIGGTKGQNALIPSEMSSNPFCDCEADATLGGC